MRVRAGALGGTVTPGCDRGCPHITGHNSNAAPVTTTAPHQNRQPGDRTFAAERSTRNPGKGANESRGQRVTSAVTPKGVEHRPFSWPPPAPAEAVRGRGLLAAPIAIRRVDLLGRARPSMSCRCEPLDQRSLGLSASTARTPVARGRNGAGPHAVRSPGAGIAWESQAGPIGPNNCSPALLIRGPHHHSSFL